MSKNSVQMRIRLSDEAATAYGQLPPVVRGRVISMILLAASQRHDLRELASFRRELISLGNLLNQSLRSSWGASPDATACRAILKILKKLCS